MNMRANSPLLLLITAALLSACQTSQQSKKHRPHAFGYNGTQDDQTQVIQETPPAPAETAATDQTPPAKSEVAPPPPSEIKNPANPTTMEKKDFPYAKPVPGKSGFVISPFAPYSGFVDVRGYPPGTEVKCPYTNKIFLIPVP